MHERSPMHHRFSATFLVLLSLLISSPLAGAGQSQTTGVLIVAHGAGPSWNAPVEAIGQAVRRDVPVEVGFLMGSGQTAQAAYDKLVAQGVSTIVIVPMLVSSYSAHAEQIRFLGGLRADYPHAEHMQLTQLKGPARIVAVTQAMDDDPIVAAILADRARALSRRAADETLVLVAHGPNEDAEAAQWTSVMTRLADEIRKDVPFKHVDIRLLRDDAPKPVKDRALAELRESVATRAKSGRVVVVPLLLAAGAVGDQIPATLAGLDFAWDGKTLLPDERLAQ